MYLRRESRKCPTEFQDRLTRLFGRNQFGDPNFIIVWGQTYTHRMGTLWTDKYGNSRRGYRDVLQGSGQPCWMIMRWKAPFEYGNPRSFYSTTYDASTDTYILGEYPWRGRYEIVHSLISKEFVNGKLEITHFPLSHAMIDSIIPFILAFQRLSKEEQKAARDLAKAKAEKEETEQLADLMSEYLPTWYGPVSYSRQGCHTSLLDRKMQAIQKTWDDLCKGGRRPRFASGLSLGDRPAIASRI